MQTRQSEYQGGRFKALPYRSTLWITSSTEEKYHRHPLFYYDTLL